ncbi:MAG: hypothetical protein IJQ39_04350 [Thermoguttaceae bacterium]|nr:hypothetical protein [Thermoguttaceae bacterium]
MAIKIFNVKALLIVLAIGVVVIVATEMMHPERWSWMTQENIPGENVEIKPLEQRVYYPGVDKDALQNIVDNSYWVSSDLPAWQNLVKILRDVPQSELNKYSFGHVPYVQLKSTPKAFRGVLINVRGNARQCIPIKQTNKDVDIEYIYQIAVSPDSSPSEPIIINTLSIPSGFPTGEDIEPQRIECTGFFIKRWAYPAQEDVLTAPLVMAKELSWQEPIKSAATNNEPPFWLIIGIIILGAVGIYMLIELRIKSSLPPKPKKIPVEEFVFTLPTENLNNENSEDKAK